MDKVAGPYATVCKQLESTPEPARFYVISGIFQNHIYTQKRIGLAEKQLIEECFRRVAQDVASTQVLVDHVVEYSRQRRGKPEHSAEDAYSILLTVLSSYSSNNGTVVMDCIRAVSHGLMDVFESDESCWFADNVDGHYLMKAWSLEPRVGVTFLSRVERYMRRGGRSLTEYFQSVGRCLVAMVIRSLHRSPGHPNTSSISFSQSVRNCIVRLCYNEHVHVEETMQLMVDLLCAYDLGHTDHTVEAEACVWDLIDVVSAEDGSIMENIDDTSISFLLTALLDRFMGCRNVGASPRVFLEAITAFVPSHASLCGSMIVPLSVRGLQYGESQDARLCFALLVMILGTTPKQREVMDIGVLSIVECICLRSRFYISQTHNGSRLQQILDTCLAQVQKLMEGGSLKGLPSAGMDSVRWDCALEVITWIQKVEIICCESQNVHHRNMSGENSYSVLLLIAQTVGLLHHTSIFVRLQVLEVIVSLARTIEGFSFFVLPSILERVQECQSMYSDATSDNEKGSVALFLKELLYVVASLVNRSCNTAAVPFIVKTLEPLIDPEKSPRVVQAAAYRILCTLFTESTKGYQSLRVALLGCDMEDDIEARADGNAWYSTSVSVEKIGTSLCLLDICSVAPLKGKDFVHVIHACVRSKHPKLAATGLECIKILCDEGILNFVKAWKVVRKVHPDLPTNEIVASSWVSLISCALSENPDLHEVVLKEVIELIWDSSSSSSAIIRMHAYKALSRIQWDTAEKLDALRSPVTYAMLMKQDDGTHQDALNACVFLLEYVLQEEHEDRRKQYIQLSGTISKQIKQSHSTRFSKLTSTIPRILLKESKGRNTVLTCSGAGSQVFVILNLWSPEVQKKSNGFQLFKKASCELLGADSTSCYDLLLDPENVVLLCDGWKAYFHRWFRYFDVNEHSGATEYQQDMETVQTIWKECIGPVETIGTLLNPNIPSAIVAFALQFGGNESSISSRSFEYILRVVQDPLQHPTMRSLCVILLGLLSDNVKQTLGDVTVKTLVENVLSAEDISENSRIIALRYCFEHKVSHQLIKSKVDDISSMSIQVLNQPDMHFADDDSLDESLKAFGSIMYNYRSEAVDVKSICGTCINRLQQVTLETQRLIPGFCEVLYFSIIRGYEESLISDGDVTSYLDSLSSILDNDLTSPHKGSLSYTIARIITGALRAGFLGTENWNIDTCIALLRSKLYEMERYSNVRLNAAKVCQGLCFCIEYLMVGERNQDESCMQENLSENELESVCRLSVASAIRMGCTPHIATICRKAIEFKNSSDAHSFESISSSAVGYLTEALMTQYWPVLEDEKPVPMALSMPQSVALIECLSAAPRLPPKDWSACLRRCIRKYPNEDGFHVSVLKFVCQHSTGSVASKIKDFVRNDVFSVMDNPLQPRNLCEPALWYALSNFGRLSKLLNEDEVVLCLTSLESALNRATSYSNCILSIAEGLHDMLSTGPPVKHEIASIAFDAMVQMLFRTIDSSKSSLQSLYCIYSLDDKDIAKLARGSTELRKWHSAAPYATEIQSNTRLGAYLFLALNQASSKTLSSVLLNQALFDAHPVLHSWLASAFLVPTGNFQFVSLSRNHVMTHHDLITTQIAVSLANGIRSYLIKSPNETSLRQTYSWAGMFVGTEEQGRKDQGACIAFLLSLVGIYTAMTHNVIYDLSVNSSLDLLPEALEYILGKHGHSRDICSKVLPCLQTVDSCHSGIRAIGSRCSSILSKYLY